MTQKGQIECFQRIFFLLWSVPILTCRTIKNKSISVQIHLLFRKQFVVQIRTFQPLFTEIICLISRKPQILNLFSSFIGDSDVTWVRAWCLANGKLIDDGQGLFEQISQLSLICQIGNDDGDVKIGFAGGKADNVSILSDAVFSISFGAGAVNGYPSVF